MSHPTPAAPIPRQASHQSSRRDGAPRLGPIPLLMAASLLAIAALPGRAAAGACASFGTLGLALVSPGGAIPQGSGAGPILRTVIGSQRAPRGDGRQSLLGSDPLSTLRIRGPRGAVRAQHRQLAPGIYRLSGPFAPGRYTLRGIEHGGSLRISGAAATALRAPHIRSALVTVMDSGSIGAPRPGRYGPTRTRSLTLELTQPPPAEAWMLLLYRDPSGNGGAAMHFAEIYEGSSPGTRFSFSEGGGGRRCGPSLPRGSVPTANTVVGAAWLSRDGRLSPVSNPVSVRE